MNPLAILARLGAAVLSILAVFGRVAIFAFGALTHIVRPPYYPREFAHALLNIGWLSLPVVGLTAIFTGGALALQIYAGGARFNAEAVVPQIVAIGMVRELGPVLVGLMIAARVTSSIAAEIATMKVTEQIVRTSVKVPLNENEFSALSILAYNIGSGAFWNSTVLRLLNEDNRLGAADAFLMWNKISQDGELQVSTNLSERRAAERDLFLAKPDDFQGPS